MKLVGGLEHEVYFSIYWEESSQLTNIFFRGVETTNQYNMISSDILQYLVVLKCICGLLKVPMFVGQIPTDVVSYIPIFNQPNSGFCWSGC